MDLNVPQPIAEAIRPLVEVLPLADAMTALVVTHGTMKERVELVERICNAPEIASRPALQSGLWLYVDALDRSHTISQGMDDATGSFWHGIMHRREGDFSNSHYWLNRAGQHPAMKDIPEYDGHAFIDAVAARHGSGDPALVAKQRDEWAGLFNWCANR